MQQNTDYLMRYECYLCGEPRMIWEIIIRFNHFICRACNNYEGPRLPSVVEHIRFQRENARQQQINHDNRENFNRRAYRTQSETQNGQSLRSMLQTNRANRMNCSNPLCQA